MKKLLLLLPFLFLGLLFSCEKEAYDTDLPADAGKSNKNKKVDVCHNGHIINVSINAVSAHQLHGDAVDIDGDGYFDKASDCGFDGLDCDDNDPNVNPGAEEVCGNDQDDDCDGNTDCSDVCTDDTMLVDIDPDGTPNSGDEYSIHYYDENLFGLSWNPDGTLAFIPPDSDSEHDGLYNTQQIVINTGDWNDGNYAAKQCALLSELTDCEWYLPTIFELQQAYQQLGAAPNAGFLDGQYWTSNPRDEDDVYVVDMSTGQVAEQGSVSDEPICRCVRKN